MATDLTAQSQLTLMAAGTAPTMTAADITGHTVLNPAGAEVNIWVNNASASVLTMTVTTARDSNFGTFPDKTLSIQAASLVVLSQFSARRFTSPETGKLTFTLSAVTSVTVAAVTPGQYFQEA